MKTGSDSQKAAPVSFVEEECELKYLEISIFPSSLSLQNNFDVAFCQIYTIEQVGYPLFFDWFSYLAIPFPLDSNVLPLFGKAQDATDSTREECVFWVVLPAVGLGWMKEGKKGKGGALTASFVPLFHLQAAWPWENHAGIS